MKIIDRMLRAIEHGEVTPLGSTRPRKVDLRIIAATHQPLEVTVRGCRFRQDLFYRLKLARVHLPLCGAGRKRTGAAQHSDSVGGLPRHPCGERRGRCAVPPPCQDKLIGNLNMPARHGGVIAGFAETAATRHLIRTLRSAKFPKSIDFSIDYLRSGRPRELCRLQGGARGPSR